MHQDVIVCKGKKALITPSSFPIKWEQRRAYETCLSDLIGIVFHFQVQKVHYKPRLITSVQQGLCLGEDPLLHSNVLWPRH